MPRFIHPSTMLWASCLALWSAFAQAQSQGMGDIMSEVFDSPLVADSAAVESAPGGAPTARGSAVPVQGIEGVGFIQVYRSGPEIVPVVLFANGEACRDMALLSGNETIAAHKAANPDAWTKWRRQQGKLQILKKQGWSDFPFQNATGPFGDGYSLNRRYKRLNTISIDVDNRAASTNTYSFAADGTFTHGRSAFTTSNVGETGATIAHVPEDQRGEYRIDGYLLTLAYADGKQVVKAIVTDDPDDPGVIWLDGYSYVDD